MGDGVGSQDGKPLPCFMAGLYDDEKLIPIPTWSDLRFYDGKKQFKIDKDAPYRQVLNMKTGILTTYATWRAGDKTLKGKIEVIVSRAKPNLALIYAELYPNFKGQISAVSELGKPADGLTGGSNGNQIESQGFYGTRHSNVSFILTRWLLSPQYGVSWSSTNRNLNLNIYVWPKTPAIIASRTHVIIAKSDDGGALEAAEREMVRRTQIIHDHAHFLRSQQQAMAKLWQRDIIIDGPRKDQQAIHSCMFYLLQSVREGSQWSIPPLGLSGDSFSGHVFWDADTWMFPALILQHPELARAIVDYRYNTLPGAIANAKASGYKGAEYAWESGYTGKEDTPPGLTYRHERHIDGDVALAQWQYYLATGDLNWLKTRGYPVIKATADYWASRAMLNNGRYEIKRVVPPDESAEMVDNSVYTNAIAKMNLEIAVRAAQLTHQSANPKWQAVAEKMYIPFDAKAKRFIAFDGYKGYKAKQADTELLAYPLQFAALPDKILIRDLSATRSTTTRPRSCPKGRP